MRIFILSLVLGLFSLETMALSCDITNYQDYIRNGELTVKLVEETKVGCNLTKADLEGADLQGAILWKANLEGADLRGANLEGAFLWKANLQGADLKGADLREASLWYVNLTEANLQEAKLQGANFEWAVSKGANFENAIYNNKTKFPGWDDSFKKEHNMIEMIEEK